MNKYTEQEATMQNKQIEEMAKILREECFYDLKEISVETSERLAITLLKYYQPKLPEDSIVLTKEELQENYVSKSLYTQLQEVSLARKEQIDKLGQKLFQAREETIERDFRTTIKTLEDVKEQVKLSYGINESVGVDMAIRTVKQLAKEMVVENLC
jgi:hypothetical protein